MDDRALLRVVSSIIGEEWTRDDCAVITVGDTCLLLTTDMLHRSTDFPGGMSDWQVGWMAAAVSLSDLAAMAARPLGLLLAIGLDREESLRGVMEGAQACAGTCGTRVVGGDLDYHRELTIVSCAAGITTPGRVVRRRGARPGDVIGLTGVPGQAQAALSGHHEFDDALLTPVPALQEGQALGAAGASAMMDVSDGLALSLHDLAEVNELRFSVEGAKIPLPRGLPEEEATEYALFGGGDYGLLFTISPDTLPGREFPVTIIGSVFEGHGVTCDGDPLPRRGYLHQW